MALFANLVGRLSLDSSAFDRNARRASTSMYSMKRQSLALQKGILNLAGAYIGVHGLSRAIRSTIQAYAIQQKAEHDLTAALVNTGGMLGDNIDTFKAYASAIQQATVYGDEEILSQMAYATNLGVTRDRLKEATKAAVGLAAKYRIDLKSAFMLIGRASQGQTQMLTRYGIVLEDTLTDQQKFNEILKLGASAFSLARAETETLEGQFKQLKNTWGDVKESFGQIGARPDTIKDLKNLADALREVADGFENVEYVLNRNRAMDTTGVGAAASGMTDALLRMRAEQSRGGLPQGRLDISPRGYQRLAEMRARARAIREGVFDYSGALPGTEYRVEPPAAETEAETEAKRKAAMDIAAAYRRMYNDLDQRSEQSWNLRKQLLIEEYNSYAATMGAETKELEDNLIDKAELLEQWYEERQRDLEIQMDKMTGTIAESVTAHLKEYTETIKSAGQIIGESLVGGFDDLAGAISNAVFEARDLNEAIKDVIRSMARMAFEEATRSLIRMGIGALLGTPTFHGGGDVGGGMQVMRRSSAADFIGAQRYHSGGDVPALLQAGERVQSRQQVAASNRDMGRMVALLERIAAKPAANVAVVRSEEEIIDAMKTRAGEEVIVRAMQRNR